MTQDKIDYLSYVLSLPLGPCEECCQELDRDCNGTPHCTWCDEPCDCCWDGGYPGDDDKEEDDNDA